MSRGFSSLGTGSTDKITTALTTGVDQRSWFIWSYRVGHGGGNFGRMWQQSNAIEQTFLDDDEATATNTYRFAAGWSGTSGGWSFTAPSANVWHSIGVKYDWGSDANNPTIYLDSTILTVGSGLTEIFPPVGSGVNGNGETMLIGNRADNIRVWDGMLAEFAVWNALLTDAEFMSLAKGFSPAFIRPASRVEYIPMLRANVSYKLAAPTIVGALVQPHPRIIMPHRLKLSSFTGAGAGQTLFPAHFAKRSYVALVTQ